MKNFGLGVLKENGEIEECSAEFLEPTEINFDISSIESHHPTIYSDGSWPVELEVEVNEKAWVAYIETPAYKAYDEADKAVKATLRCKAYDEAIEALEKVWEAVKATPKGKAFEGACKAKEKAWEALKATPEYKALEGTPEWKDFEEALKAEDEAWEELNNEKQNI